ncbi:hypothetical protein [Thalassorhabdomicrobium marinisediminis]|uniref:hypothetical protein n=1 Tax=Thalassorhabdomicrobium marinisediminis TaxID=2170577 RepID=UPI0024921249|nr:hypothetical protein [Thalassorhabdomicrobium marinisediminis]
MQMLAFEDDTAHQTGSHRFVVNLKVPKNGSVLVRSCEVIGGQYRNRFTFPSQVTIADVFEDQLAQGVMKCLSSLSRTTEVVSLPTLSIEVPGLTLAKAHLIANLSDSGELSIILRFKMILGNISRAFLPALGIEDSVTDHASHMSALVLTDIVMPLLDMCTLAEVDTIAKSDAVDRFVETLSDRSRDVRFQAELIKRFVNSASAPAAETRKLSTAQPVPRLTGSD